MSLEFGKIVGVFACQDFLDEFAPSPFKNDATCLYSFYHVFLSYFQGLSSSSEFYYSSKRRQGLRKDSPWRQKTAWLAGLWRCPRQAVRSDSWLEFPWESVFFAKPKNTMTRRKMPKNPMNIGSRNTRKSTDCFLFWFGSYSSEKYIYRMGMLCYFCNKRRWIAVGFTKNLQIQL